MRAFPVAENGTASVFGAGGGLTDGEAALVNGAMAHSLELDDDHRLAVLHPGAVVIPAAFAVGEATGASGTRFLQGVLAGYEVACRVGEVFRGSLFQYGLHPTAVCGVFGAAAAAGVILGLDKDAHTRALGIAGTQAAGLTEWREDGSWIKRLHPGRAAQSGVIAARLAKEGFTGPATIFEGEGGYFKAIGHDGPMDRDALTRGLTSDYRALGTAVKPYPCCRFAHGAIDLAIAARRAGKDPRRAGAVGVRIYRSGVLTYRHRPLNSVDAQFNVPYLVAVALSQGRVGLNDFTEAAVQRPEILDLAARVQVVEDERFTAEYPDKYLTELTIEGGGDYRGLSECPSGDPEAARYAEDPDLMRREVTEKVATLLEETGFGDRSASLIELVDGLDAASDLGELAELLRRSPGAKRHSRSVS
jgi:2-methylcitrate dehydratase PrpD